MGSGHDCRGIGVARSFSTTHYGFDTWKAGAEQVIAGDGGGTTRSAKH
jgi:hypothetical protein